MMVNCTHLVCSACREYVAVFHVWIELNGEQSLPMIFFGMSGVFERRQKSAEAFGTRVAERTYARIVLKTREESSLYQSSG